jgi:hypothetical protein
VGYVLLPTRATRSYVVQQTSRLGERGVNVTGELERHFNPNLTLALAP